MTFVPVPNTVEVDFLYLWQNQQCENTLYFKSEVELSTIEMNVLCAALVSWWDTHMKALVSTNVSLNAIRCTGLNSATDLQVEWTTGLPKIGTNSSPSLPNNVTWAVTFATAGRGRSGRGRNFVVGLTETQCVYSQIDVAIANLYLAAYNDLVGTGGIAIDWTWCVVSRYSGGVPRVTGLAQPVHTVKYADLILDSQRRRLPSRGR